MTDKQYEKCVKIARKKLSEVKKVQYRHFAFILKGSKVLVIGVNSSTTHPKSNTPYRAKHAEFDALNRFKNIFPEERLDNKSFLVLRINNQGIIRMSRPCSCCISFIGRYNVDRIFYSDRDGQLAICHI